MFDSMAFTEAANNAYNESIDYEITLRNLVTQRNLVGVRVTQAELDAHIADPNYDVLSQKIYNPSLKELVYDNTALGDEGTWTPDFDGITGHRIEGEALGLTPWGSNASVQDLNLGEDVNLPGIVSESVARHSMSTLAIRMFADESEVGSNAWEQSAKYFWPVMYDDEFAEEIGMFNVDGALSQQDKYSDILRQAIAYSAIDEGERPFGDTGIRALYNDANDLGGALGLAEATAVLSDYAEHISKVLVQFAGQLALADIQSDEGIGTSGGVLENAAEGVVMHDATAQTLTVNLDAAIWDEIAAGVQPQTHIVAPLLAETGYETAIRDAMDSQRGGNSINAIDRAVFTTVDGATTTLTDNPAAVADTGTFFVGGNGDDVVTGSSGNEVIYGGDGNDRFSHSSGLDILVGGSGSDTADYSGASDGESFYINLSGLNESYVDTSAAGDTFYGVEDITGTSGDDRFVIGGGSDMVLAGGGGTDTLEFAYGWGDNAFGVIKAPLYVDLTAADGSGTAEGTFFGLGGVQDALSLSFSGMSDYKFTQGSDAFVKLSAPSGLDIEAEVYAGQSLFGGGAIGSFVFADYSDVTSALSFDIESFSTDPAGMASVAVQLKNGGGSIDNFTNLGAVFGTDEGDVRKRFGYHMPCPANDNAALCGHIQKVA